MRASVLTASLALGVTLVLGSAYLAVDMLLLGRIEPKWGGRWDNFLLGLLLLAIAALVEALFLGIFVAIATRRSFGSLRPRLAAAVAMAVFTMVIWPPTARRIVLMAILVAALSLLAGSVSVWLSQRAVGEEGEGNASAGA